MQLYSDTLRREQLDEFAAQLDLTLYNAEPEFHGARKRRVRFTLRPLGETFRRRQNGRRLWAVSWDGHYEFMRRVFDADPAAKIVSAISTWDGRDDFLARAGTPSSDWIS